MSLFPSLAPLRPPPGIDYRLGDIRDTLTTRGAALIHADPCWQYSEGAAGKGMAQPELNGIYKCMTDADIAAILDLAYDCASPGARLVCWATWPKLMEFLNAGGAGKRWEYVTGGAWLKERQVGVGFHWRGQTEPALVFIKRGAPAHVDRDHLLLNGYASIPEEHSRKPLPWLRTMLRAWTALTRWCSTYGPAWLRWPPPASWRAATTSAQRSILHAMPTGVGWSQGRNRPAF